MLKATALVISAMLTYAVSKAADFVRKSPFDYTSKQL